MHTVYCSNISFDPPSITISDQDEIHHMKNVLRISAGEAVRIINNKDQSGTGVVENIKRDSATIKIIEFQNAVLKKPYLILACAIPKKSKFETIIEKAVELNVDEIIPLLTERTEVKPPSQSKKEDRYRTIAINAVKQSKRSSIPIIKPPQKFSQALKELIARGTVIMPSLEGTRIPLQDSLSKKTPDVISIMIGPEGDFTSLEYSTAHANGVVAVSLGETILRVETAAITVLSAIKYFYYK